MSMSLSLWTSVVTTVRMAALIFQQHLTWLLYSILRSRQVLQSPSIDTRLGSPKALLSKVTTELYEKETRQFSRKAPMTSNTRLTILMAGDTFPPDVNGAAIFTLQLAAGLASRGHELHVIVPSANGVPGVFEECFGGAKVTVHRLQSVHWGCLTSLRCAVPWNVRQDVSPIIDLVKPDIVHIQSFFQIGRGVAREAYLRNIPIVATNHFLPENAMDCNLFGKLITWLGINFLFADAARTYQLVAIVTAPTRTAAVHLESAMNLVQHTVQDISCGIHVGHYTSRTCRPDLNEILFLGRLAPEKHLVLLLTAFSLLPPELDARLRIAGNGKMLADLKSLAHRLKVADRVTFMGHVSEAEKQDAFSHAAVFVMPSTAELQSLSCLEAMASGLPLVAANSMALPHLIQGNGYLFEPGNKLDLMEKLVSVLTADEQEYTRMRTRSREIAQTHDIHETLQAYESTYHTSLQNRERIPKINFEI